MRTLKRLVCGLALLTTSKAAASVLATFKSLDHEELRAAEARISEYLEAGTARLLRAPENAAERYVVARQQRLAAELEQQSAAINLADGEQVQGLFWPLARASQLGIGPDGRARIECMSAQVLLGRELPDFRSGNGERRPVQ